MVRYGYYDTIWYDGTIQVRSGTIWYDTIWYDVKNRRYDTIRYGTAVRYDTVRYDTVLYVTLVRNGTIRYG